MNDSIEFIYIMNMGGYRIEAIISPINIDEVTLWVTKPGSDLKMKMGEISSDKDGELTPKMIAEMVNENLEMKKFDFECLLKSAISEGLIERN